MKTNSIDSTLQACFNDWIGQFTQATALGSLLSPADLQSILQAGWSQLLQSALEAERSVHLGAPPVPREIPRTRQGFYPALLPKHQRYLPDAYQQLLQNILLGARSFKAALRTMQALGLSYVPDQLESLLEQIHQEAKTFFSRPRHPDWLFVFADAKIIELKDEHDQVKKAVHFLIVGVTLNGNGAVVCIT